ncbi:hypothetical protein HJG60_010766 [Phyllostomus discolor]|uniref:Uncharacterized protein n=1 Tax=Phyllostomus discolor TaxID=89673 RepID=A0A834EA89_9CHIR|nr:hypothetical protein HJG60_010766 [Phyllostomus discolor]
MGLSGCPAGREVHVVTLISVWAALPLPPPPPPTSLPLMPDGRLPSACSQTPHAALDLLLLRPASPPSLSSILWVDFMRAINPSWEKGLRLYFCSPRTEVLQVSHQYKIADPSRIASPWELVAKINP